MRILHIISNLETGGAQRLVSDLVPALQSDEDKADVLVYSKKDTCFEKVLEERGVRVISAGLAPGSGRLKTVRTLRKFLKGYDVAHVHLFPTLYDVAAAARGLPVKLVFTEHSTHNRRRDHSVLRPIERLVYSRYDVITAISEAVSQSLSSWLGPRIARRIRTVNNGIVIPENKIAETPAGKEMVMISRFVPAKDHRTVIDALALTADKEITVTFAGSGELLEAMRGYAKEKGVADRCRFPGNVNDIQTLIDRCLAGIQSSNWEGFGLTALEFMSRGKPMTGSDVEGLRDIIGDAGLIFPKGDARALADILDNLASSPDLCNDLARKGLRRASEFDIKRTAAKMKEIYATLLRD